MENTTTTSATSIEKQIDSFLEHFKRSASRAIEAEWCTANRTASGVIQRNEDSSSILSSVPPANGGDSPALACSSPRLSRNQDPLAVRQDTGKFRSRSFRCCQLFSVSFHLPHSLLNSCSANTVQLSTSTVHGPLLVMAPQDSSWMDHYLPYSLCCIIKSTSLSTWILGKRLFDMIHIILNRFLIHNTSL